MADNARGTHSTAGVYTREFEIGANVKSLGITNLGLVGETLYGPAFEPIAIADWAEFKKNFGGFNATKFKGSQYPKYELPYIAKAYLEQSQQLQVVRVLGLSGYNAGPAWLVVDNQGKVIAVIRSRGSYEKLHKYTPSIANDCKCGGSVYDHLRYDIGEWDDEMYDCSLPVSYNMDALHIGPYVSLEDAGNECEGYTINGVPVEMSVNSSNYGVFTLYGTTSEGHYFTKDEAAQFYSAQISIDDYCKGSKYFTVKGEKVVAYMGADEKSWYMKTLDELGGVGVEVGEKDPTDDSSTCVWISPSGNHYFVNGVRKSVGYFKYAVSLNPADKNYILKVIGSKVDDQTAPIFCESLYDVSLMNGIQDGSTTAISSALVGYNVYRTYDYSSLKSVGNFVQLPEEALSKKHVSNRYLIDENTPVNVHPYDYNTNKPYAVSAVTDASGNVTSYSAIIADGFAEGDVTPTIETFKFELATSGDYEGLYICDVDNQEDGSGNTIAQNVNFPSGTILFVDTTTNTIAVKGSDLIGQAVTVRQLTVDGRRHYIYTYYTQGSVYGAFIDKNTGEYKANVITYLDRLNYIESVDEAVADTNNNIYRSGLIKVEADGYYYRVIETADGKSVVRVSVDVNDYKSSYRFASTPWIVSNAKGDRSHIELHKLFRFHTITDGNNANGMFKVSIKDIAPDEGTFKVQIRAFDDTDASPVVLEEFSKCNLEIGSSNYIAYKIGSYDGTFESKSKYVTVEMAEGDNVRLSSPAGFVGYPINFYNGYQAVGDFKDNVKAPTLPYNTEYYEDLKPKKQYFGISDLAGIDIDVFNYKGDKYYNENDTAILSDGFHLDCRVSQDSYTDEFDNVVISVDGQTGYTFTTVNSQLRANGAENSPIIATEQDMEGTIYEDKNMRKFTVMFYGGFDGWDEYRDQRTNTDEFTRANYKGQVASVNDEGVNFKGVSDGEKLGLTGAAITSDYYAYLAGVRQFANPNNTEINLLATAGIDYVNQTELVKDVIEMIEEERKDTLYVVTTPDKPSGSEDYEENMFTAEEAVENLADTNIDSTYATTFFPWVKFLDTTNNQYIYLPPTKDVLRNMAMVDNQLYSWYAAAGTSRGNVDAVRTRKVLNIGETDVLYDNFINPIQFFVNEGIKIWGNKTMYTSSDETQPLNRVTIRRLMLTIRKKLVDACRHLIFDPNDVQEKDKADSAIRPILSNIKANRGIVDFKIEYDTSEEARERLELPIKVWVKPTKPLEYVPIDFMITNQSMDFDNL